MERRKRKGHVRTVQVVIELSCSIFRCGLREISVLVSKEHPPTEVVRALASFAHIGPVPHRFEEEPLLVFGQVTFKGRTGSSAGENISDVAIRD